MISIYTTAFNLENFKIDLVDAIDNWLVYGEEIIVATINEDYEKIKDIIKSSKFSKNKKIKIVSENIDIKNDIFWDGKLKNLSLKNCSNDVVLQVDLDERLSGSKKIYKMAEEEILSHDFPCSIMIPTINLYGDLDHYKDIGYKWYMHTRKDTFRGAVDFAIQENGMFDPEKSDTCELIDKDGKLIPCIAKLPVTSDGPKVIHLGCLDFSRKAHINQKFWRKEWSQRKTLSQGKDVDAEDLFTDPSEFKDTKIKHNLKTPLWPTI